MSSKRYWQILNARGWRRWKTGYECVEFKPCRTSECFRPIWSICLLLQKEIGLLPWCLRLPQFHPRWQENGMGRRTGHMFSIFLLTLVLFCRHDVRSTCSYHHTIPECDSHKEQLPPLPQELSDLEDALGILFGTNFVHPAGQVTSDVRSAHFKDGRGGCWNKNCMKLMCQSPIQSPPFEAVKTRLLSVSKLFEFFSRPYKSGPNAVRKSVRWRASIRSLSKRQKRNCFYWSLRVK